MTFQSNFYFPPSKILVQSKQTQDKEQMEEVQRRSISLYMLHPLYKTKILDSIGEKTTITMIIITKQSKQNVLNKACIQKTY